MTLLDLTPEECRALGREMAERAMDEAFARGEDLRARPWEIEWDDFGYAKPVPPKGEA